MNARTQRFCAWSGSVAMIVAGIGMFGSGLFPPISPDASPHAVMHLYASHPTRMRAGLLLTFVAFGLWGPWVAAITTQMRRIGNVSPLLANLQAIAGATAWVFLLMPILFFAVVAFRPFRDPNVLQGINDIGWITFIMPFVPFVVQPLAIGIGCCRTRARARSSRVGSAI